MVRANQQQNYKSLLDFSLGNANEVTTLGKLGIDQTEDLFLLMAQARLPMPLLPGVVAQDMMEKLNLLPNAHR